MKGTLGIDSGRAPLHAREWTRWGRAIVQDDLESQVRLAEALRGIKKGARAARARSRARAR